MPALDPDEHRSSGRDPSPPSAGVTAGIGLAGAGIGVGALLVVCCAGPALIAAGALGAVGGLLGSPWVIAAELAALSTGIAVAVRRRRAGRNACCPPTGVGATPTHQEGPYRR